MRRCNFTWGRRWHLGLYVGTLGMQFGILLALWETSGVNFSNPGLHLGILGIHFGVCLPLWGVALATGGHFWGQGSKKAAEMTQLGSPNGGTVDDIVSFSGKWQTAFGSSQLERSGVQASCF